MLASSFEKYIHRYGVVPEINPVIFTNNSTTISLLKSLISLGHKPAAYVDARNEKEIEKELKTLQKSIDKDIETTVQKLKGVMEIKKFKKFLLEIKKIKLLKCILLCFVCLEE